MKLLHFLFRILAFLYPYKLHCKLQSARNTFYTLWIRNFVGHLDKHSRICYPCSLQGGGQKNISTGDYTTIQGTSILGCWIKYGNQQFPNASITIGNHCNIGEYNHITACNKIIIGDGLLTGCYVIISDNSHGGLSEEEAEIAPQNANCNPKEKSSLATMFGLETRLRFCRACILETM